MMQEQPPGEDAGLAQAVLGILTRYESSAPRLYAGLNFAQLYAELVLAGAVIADTALAAVLAGLEAEGQVRRLAGRGAARYERVGARLVYFRAPGVH